MYSFAFDPGASRPRLPAVTVAGKRFHIEVFKTPQQAVGARQGAIASIAQGAGDLGASIRAPGYRSHGGQRGDNHDARRTASPHIDLTPSKDDLARNPTRGGRSCVDFWKCNCGRSTSSA